jgi:hypothetical protein
MSPRSSIAAPIVAAVAIVLLPLAVYVGGYFYLGVAQVWYFSGPVDPLSRGGLQAIHRTYRNKTLANLYEPAGKVEAWLRGINVEVADYGPP